MQPLLEALRDIHWEDMDAREGWHGEEMEAQKQAHVRMTEMQKAELNALKEAHAEQLGALVAHLPKRGESAVSIFPVLLRSIQRRRFGRTILQGLRP